MNIYQKINKVMQEVQYVQKDKAVTGGGQNYKAVTHDQVVSVCRESLVNNGIVIFPNQLEGEFLVKRDLNLPTPVKMGLYSGKYEINFVSIDDPESRITLTVEAHAQDNGDKAPGKALTYATKSAILKVLNLETGENDESRAEQADIHTINEEQQATLFNLLCTPEGQYTENGLKICKAYKFNNLNEIKAKKFDEILKQAQRLAQ